jgi:hypothetical protein
MVPYQFKSLYEVIWHGDCNVEAVSQEYEVSKILDGGLHYAIINNLE